MSESGADGLREQPQVETANEFPSRRVILLGASNLAIHLPTIVETSRRLWGGPLDVLAAAGHGRSYGTASRVLGRVLPGILDCGLWSDWERRPPAPTAALVTDIGNDLLYGRSVEQTAAWVDECLARLARVAERLIVTELPLASVQTLSEARFQFLSRVLFPSCRLTLAETLARCAHLNQCVRELAAAHRAKTIAPQGAWYGFDPIHIRRSRGAQVWREILGLWSPASEIAAARASWSQWLALLRLRPLERNLWGFEQRHQQPAGRLRDGTTISLY